MKEYEEVLLRGELMPKGVVLIICVIYLISFIFINKEIIKTDKTRKRNNYPDN
jgi:hypothetical protein